MITTEKYVFEETSFSIGGFPKIPHFIYNLPYMSDTNYDFRAVLYRSRVSCDILLIHKDSTIDVSAIIPSDGNGASTRQSQGESERPFTRFVG